MTRAIAVTLAIVLAGGLHPLSAQRGSSSRTDWRTGAVCYEVFVRSFADSDGDGIGDLRGLISRLDYISDGRPSAKRDLGARCIWLMPVAESPSYHGYDVTDYYRIERDYGTNEDFKRLVADAHRRGIRVLVDMVLNHTSSEHPYFQAALRDTASPYRDWFRWSRMKPSEKGPWGQEVWHKSPARDEYYYGVFWGGMPDLRYDHLPVREEAKRIATFWLEEMGVDGFRLDAIPYLVESAGQLAHTPATHAVLREYAAHVRRVAPDAFTIGEVWDSTGAMLSYYPDQLDAHFAFDAADAILRAVRESAASRLYSTYLRLQRELPAERWAPFLRNHDQRRTITELGGDVGRARAAAALLLTLPGLPFLYYGEEIGMSGDKPDERLRTPMHWSTARAAGFTAGRPWQPLQADSATANVAVQDSVDGSLLNVHRELIHLRAVTPALARGSLVPLRTDTDTVAAFLRRDGARSVLVIVNLGHGRRDVTVTSDAGALAPGRYALTPLLGRVPHARLQVDVSGRLRPTVLLRALGAHATHIFALRHIGP